MEDKETTKSAKIIRGLSQLVIMFVIGILGFAITISYFSFFSELRNERRAIIAEDRITAKAEYITSDEYTTLDIVDVTWEKRSTTSILDTKALLYDVFLIDTGTDDLSRVVVYDTQVSGKYLVEPYTRILNLFR